MGEARDYRRILKGTGVFGGVQVVQVLLNLVRGKFIAMFLGPAGMGVAALLNSASLTLQKVSSLGLNQAIVREVASEERSEVRGEGSEGAYDLSKGEVIAVARRLITLTALLGAALCMLLAPWLSGLTFGNREMTWEFVLLGVAVALAVAFNGNLSVLQGLQNLKGVGMCSVVGGVAGVVVGVPLYWLMGVKGIVPAMIAMWGAMWAFSLREVKNEKLKINSGRKIRFEWGRHKGMVWSMVSMGLVLMAGDLAVTVVQYLINVYVRHAGSEETVGLYQAANSVTNQYAGMVFAAMAMDYFPRLSKVAADNGRMRDTVNSQTEVTAMVIAPAVGLLILTAPLVIRVLLTDEFLGVTPLMRWMGLGVLLRALMVPMGYISFAKGNRKVFFVLEGVVGPLLTLVLSCSLFKWFGLMGLGYALVADHALCLVIYYVVNRRLYGYRFDRASLGCAGVSVLLGGAVFGASLLPSEGWSYALMAASTLAAAAVCVIYLRRRIKGSLHSPAQHG